jgi:hypothetical protein
MERCQVPNAGARFLTLKIDRETDDSAHEGTGSSEVSDCRLLPHTGDRWVNRRRFVAFNRRNRH